MNYHKISPSWIFTLWLLMFTINITTGANNVPFVAKHRLTSSEYQTVFNTYTQLGYRLIYISGYTISNQERFAALFEKSSGPTQICRHGLTNSQYQQEFNSASGQGFRLTLVNGYPGTNGVDKYVAIWEKQPGNSVPLVARHGLTATQYQNEVNTWTGQGYRVTHVSGYGISNQARFAAIFEKPTSGPAWVARHGLTSAEYQTVFNTLTNQGYVLVRVSGYVVNSIDYYAAIFEKKSGYPWAAKHALTSDAYQGEFTNNYYQGYRLKIVCGYTKGNVDLYAAIWENPNINGNDLSFIDNKINAYINQHSIPGLSIAITKQERLVFAKGYGFADQANGKRVHPNNLFRIASVSKPMTAIGIMKLIEQGKFSLTSKVFGSSALLGTTYGTKSYSARLLNITVQQLLEHTSGLSNDGGDPMFMNYDLTQKELIDWVVDNRAVKNTPGTTYEYYNFGYILLGRIIEKYSAKTFEAYLQTSIFNNNPQASMISVGADSAASKKPDEVIYYPSSAYNLRVRRMDANGGLIARPIDLVGIMAKVDGFNFKSNILSSTTISTMFTGSTANSGYGKGWIVDSSYRGHNGAMTGTIAFLVRRNDGLSFAFTVNTRPTDDSFAFQLKGIMDTIVTGVSAWPTYDLF